MIGGTISHYKITEKLGEGGMGVVYKAEDTKLDRPVALKFLAPHLLRDDEGRKRFEREAKAAAKLDHPNICTVYEIDEVDGRTFIVMAFLEGRPLSERIDEGPLKLPEALSVGIQMAEGLEAAHAKGITHRDVKPDNVMLMAGSRGLVKLMDFGLAQLAGSSKFTREGTTLGTVNYMSPEQGEGAETDPRTDIWSLGVVLYEMVTGQRPFRGEFDQAILYSIMNDAPEPLTGVRTGVPRELERIVNKCLAKNAGERYQHVTDLLVDLQACRRELEPQRSQVGRAVVAPNRTSLFRFGGVAVVVLFALGLAWWFGQSSAPETKTPPEYRLTQVTRDTGYTGQPALSPDGRFLAYASDIDGEGNLDIWLHPLGGGDRIRLTTNAADEYEPSFSPDGNRVVFTSSRDGGGIYVVPALGGTPRRIAERGRRPEFSPDGSIVSFFRFGYTSDNRMVRQAWTVPSTGGTPQVIKTNLAVIDPVAWSPDGNYMLAVGCLEPTEFGAVPELDWWLLPVGGGDALNLGVREPFAAAGLQIGRGRAFPRPGSWLADGDWVIFEARTNGETRNLWRVQVSSDEMRMQGEPQRLFQGVGEESPRAAIDGRIAFMNVSSNTDIWRIPLDTNRAVVTGEPERVISGLSTEIYPSISADGAKLTYTSNRGGNQDIWLRDLRANQDRQVTIGPEVEFRGVISPDGDRVAFRRIEAERTTVYLTELGNSSERTLLEGIGSHVDFTPDGKKVLYYTNAPIEWKTIDIATGEHRDLALKHPTDPVHGVRFSPDQKWVVFKLQNRDQPIFVSPAREDGVGGPDQWISVAQSSAPQASNPWWSPDGNTVYFESQRDEFACLWAQPLDPVTKQPRGPLRAIQHFHDLLRLTTVAAPLGYGMTSGHYYLPLSELKANIWLAEPVTSAQN